MFQRMLVPVDGGEPAHAGLQEALALATAHDSVLCLLHVVDDTPLLDDLSVPDLAPLHHKTLANGEAILAQARAVCEAKDRQVETRLCEPRHGRVSDAILQQAGELACDLIVIGSHGRRGALRALLGSDAEAVIRASPVPVLLVRSVTETASAIAVNARVPYRSILVPIDGSETSDRGLQQAIQLGLMNHGRLRLIHVVDELSMVDAFEPALTLDWVGCLREGGRWILDQAAKRVREAGLSVETLLVDDFGRRVWTVVAEDATNWLADVVVLGSHGRRGFDRLLLGSDAEQILRHSPVPVLLVRPDQAAQGRSLQRTPVQGLKEETPAASPGPN